MTVAFAEPALAAIEFPAALETVADHAVTPLGADRVRSLRPRTDAFWISEELGLVADLVARRRAGDDLRPDGFPDVGPSLERLRLEGSVLDGAELVAIGTLLTAARLSFGRVTRAAREAPRLNGLWAPPLPRELEDRLAVALEPDGELRDAASPALARARRDVREVRERLVSRLTSILAGLDDRHRAPDAEVTLRNGRYVIPVRKDARGRLVGIVHDESATHSTLFVEPTEVIELGNRLKEAVAGEAREVLRVLRDLTAALREHADGIVTAFERLVELDCATARAGYALSLNAACPRVAEGPSAALSIRRAAHPLLFASGTAAVPFDLLLDPGERTVLVSGPNTGGKTVLLKAVGLAAALAQSGVVPPVGEGTVLPVFGGLFADIGDRQSIRESLSTFSAHLAALREILAAAGPDSLVLLDEVGAGTDPAEGGALAAAALRALTRRGALTVATTHLGALKRLAETERGVVNASLQFDAVRLTPTYSFVKGLPGRSYALAIARNLGVDGAVLSDAEAALPEADRTLDAALAALERRDRLLAERESSAAGREADLEAREAAHLEAARRLAEGQQLVRAREREVERAAKSAVRDYLREARSEVERAIAIAREERYREARRAMEDAMARAAAEAEAAADAGTGASPGPDAEPLGPVRPGDRVRVPSLGLEGELESLADGRASILVRGRRVRVPAADLVPAGEGGR